jgi:predicted dehydrogenase
VAGLGAIAQGYGSPQDAAPYCHVGGIRLSPRFALAAAADPFPAARENFREKWGDAFPDVALHDSLEAMLSARPYDCVAVCVRGPHHQEILRQVFAAKPRLIFLEKPPTPSLRDQDEVMDLSRRTGVPVTVSYSRHWGAAMMRMAELIRGGLIGRVRGVVAYCGGRTLSFASHTTELLCRFATLTEPGAPLTVTATGADCAHPTAAVPPEFAARGFEVEPDLWGMQVTFSNGVLATQVGRQGDHGQFYADVFGETGRARVGFPSVFAAFDAENKPIELPPVEKDGGPFTTAYGQIAAYLDGGPVPDCTGDEFAVVNEIGFGAIESIRSGAAPVALPNARRDRIIYANG